MNTKIEAVTVCENYSDYLTLGMERNRQCFDRWIIVTDPNDTTTRRLCEKNNLECVTTTKLHEDGADFAKGRAINDGLDACDKDGWLVQLDADTILLPIGFKEAIELATPLNKFALYSVRGRLLLNNDKELADFFANKCTYSIEDFTHVDWFVGYFQMWHSSFCTRYPAYSDHAGLDDAIFANDYFATRIPLFTFSIHVGPMWVHHKGRK